MLRILRDLSSARGLPIMRGGGCHAQFLVSSNGGLFALTMDSITCFCSRGGLAFMIAGGGERCILSFTLSGLYRRLGPSIFFQAGHRALISMSTVRHVRPCFLNGTIMRILPPFGSGVVIDGSGVTTFGI